MILLREGSGPSRLAGRPGSMPGQWGPQDCGLLGHPPRAAGAFDASQTNGPRAMLRLAPCGYRAGCGLAPGSAADKAWPDGLLTHRCCAAGRPVAPAVLRRRVNSLPIFVVLAVRETTTRASVRRLGPSRWAAWVAARRFSESSVTSSWLLQRNKQGRRPRGPVGKIRIHGWMQKEKGPALQAHDPIT